MSMIWVGALIFFEFQIELILRNIFKYALGLLMFLHLILEIVDHDCIYMNPNWVDDPDSYYALYWILNDDFLCIEQSMILTDLKHIFIESKQAWVFEDRWFEKSVLMRYELIWKWLNLNERTWWLSLMRIQ